MGVHTTAHGLSEGRDTPACISFSGYIVAYHSNATPFPACPSFRFRQGAILGPTLPFFLQEGIATLRYTEQHAGASSECHVRISARDGTVPTSFFGALARRLCRVGTAPSWATATAPAACRQAPPRPRQARLAGHALSRASSESGIRRWAAIPHPEARVSPARQSKQAVLLHAAYSLFGSCLRGTCSCTGYHSPVLQCSSCTQLLLLAPPLVPVFRSQIDAHSPSTCIWHHGLPPRRAAPRLERGKPDRDGGTEERSLIDLAGARAR